MQKVFITSDTHFNHKNIIKYCNRPFDSVDEMNNVLIDNWNKSIDNNDIIIHLGDFGFNGYCPNSLQQIVANLRGRKWLILGNHDKKTLGFWEELGFKYVFRKPIILHNIILSHKPILKPKMLNIHGHIHNKELKNKSKNHICVCVEKTNYYPILSEVLTKKQISINNVSIINNPNYI